MTNAMLIRYFNIIAAFEVSDESCRLLYNVVRQSTLTSTSGWRVPPLILLCFNHKHPTPHPHWRLSRSLMCSFTSLNHVTESETSIMRLDRLETRCWFHTLTSPLLVNMSAPYRLHADASHRIAPCHMTQLRGAHNEAASKLLCLAVDHFHDTTRQHGDGKMDNFTSWRKTTQSQNLNHTTVFTLILIDSYSSPGRLFQLLQLQCHTLKILYSMTTAAHIK